MSTEHNIIHTEGDFFQCQNYVLQLLSEKQISQPAFILYCFYKSTAGFSQIKYSFDYIAKNAGISKGAVSKGLKQLEEIGLIEVIRYGTNKTFDIKLVPGTNLPRRILKALDRTGELYDGDKNPDENFVAQTKRRRKKKPDLPTESMKQDVKNKYERVKNFDPMSLNPEQVKFWHDFTDEWTRHAKGAYYPKDDMYKILDIENLEEATRMIPVMWVLDETDTWVKNSDHTLSVFTHLLKIGKLQNQYPKTSFYFKDKQQNDMKS